MAKYRVDTRNNARWRKRHAYKVGFRCHWCGVKTVPPPKGVNQSDYKPFPTMATTDHLYSKVDLRRNLERRKTKVLACFKCNQDRQLRQFEDEWVKPEIIDIRDLLQ